MFSKTLQIQWVATLSFWRIGEVIVPSHLPSALVVLLLEADGPVIEARVGAVVHAENNWPAQDHPGRAATHNGAEQGLAAGQG